jgi:hypothetical protein
MQSGIGCLHHRDQCLALLREVRADTVVHEKGGEKKKEQKKRAAVACSEVDELLLNAVCSEHW